jgi:hypothetical protein
VEPPTRPVPPSTSTRALEDLFLLVVAAAGGAHALTTAILPVARVMVCVGLIAKAPPTRPVPPSTSTRALEDLFLLVVAAAGGAHALTTAILPVARVMV